MLTITSVVPAIVGTLVVKFGPIDLRSFVIGALAGRRGEFAGGDAQCGLVT